MLFADHTLGTMGECMQLQDKIAEDLKTAMKARETDRLSILRMLRTQLKNEQVRLGRALKEEEILSNISSMIRKNKEAAEEFRAAGREDLFLKEEKEVEILYEYLPVQLSRDEIKQILSEIISDLSLSGAKDMGRIMKPAMEKMAGKAEGKTVSEMARELLHS